MADATSHAASVPRRASSAPRIPDGERYTVDRRHRDPNLYDMVHFNDLNFLSDDELRALAENGFPPAIYMSAFRRWVAGEHEEALRLYNKAAELGVTSALGRAAYWMTRLAEDMPDKAQRDALLTDAAVHFLTGDIFGWGAMISNAADVFDRYPDIEGAENVCIAAWEKADSIQRARRAAGMPPFAEVDRNRLWHNMERRGLC